MNFEEQKRPPFRLLVTESSPDQSEDLQAMLETCKSLKAQLSFQMVIRTEL